jgi:hypothetical protein
MATTNPAVKLDNSQVAAELEPTISPGRASWHKSALERAVHLYGPPPSAVWLVVANVVAQRSWGLDEHERRTGLRLFRPLAKVTVVKFWRNASPQRVSVTGHHRASQKYVTAVVETRFLFDLRVRLVRSPYVIAQFWHFPEQRLRYGTEKAAAEDALNELATCASGVQTSR